MTAQTLPNSRISPDSKPLFISEPARKQGSRAQRELLTISEAAKLLGVSPSTLRRWEAEGRLVPVRTSGGNHRRYSQDNVKRLLKSFRQDTDSRRTNDVKPQIEIPEYPLGTGGRLPPKIPVRTLEEIRQPFRRRERVPHRLIDVTLLLISLALLYSAITPLTQERLYRAFASPLQNLIYSTTRIVSPQQAELIKPGIMNPIVDVNDVLEYIEMTDQEGETETGLRAKLTLIGSEMITQTLRVVKNGVFNTTQLLGTIFFGEGKRYFINHLGDATLRAATFFERVAIKTGITAGTALKISFEKRAQTGDLTGVEVDFSKITDPPSTLTRYGVHLKDAPDTAATAYGVYVEGTDWDYAGYFEDDVYIDGTLEVNDETTISGNLLPGIDSTFDIGADNNEWANLYVDEITAGTTSSGDTTLSSLIVTGQTDLQGDILDTTGNLALNDTVDIFGVLNVTGATTLSSTLDVSGNTTLGDAPTDSLTIYPSTTQFISGSSTLDIYTATGDTTLTIDNSGTGVAHLSASGDITAQGTTGGTFSGAGAGIDFSGSGNHLIQSSGGTLQLGAATLTGAITGNSQNITGLNNLTGVTSTFSTSVTSPLHTGAGAVTLSSGGGAELTIDSASGTVTFATDDDLIPTLGAGDADIGASGTPWDNIYATNYYQGSTAMGIWLDGGTYIYPSNVGTSYQIADTSGDTIITGDLTVQGGDITGANSAYIDIGEENNAGITIYGDLLPQATDQYDLGSSTLYWQDLYLVGATIYFDDTTDATLKYNATSDQFEWNPSGDASAEMTLTDAGQLALPIQGSSGGLLIGGDADLYRGGSSRLETTSYLRFLRGAAGNLAVSTAVSGDTNDRFSIYTDGDLKWGDGAAAQDTNLYRSAADTLKTDDGLIAASLTVSQDGDIIPATTTGTSDLGSSSIPWDNVYADNYYQGSTALGIWLDSGTYIYPSNVGTSYQIADTTGNTTIPGDLTMGGNIDLDGNTLILDADGDTSIDVALDDEIDLNIGGTTNAFTFIASSARGPLGSAGGPIWSFINDADTGISSANANQLDLSAGGQAALSLFLRPAAGAGGDILDSTITVQAMNGTDTFQWLDVNLTNADHTVSGNILTGIDLNLSAADAETTETAIVISGTWDYAMDAGNFPILNIGAAGTDFTATGGLTLADTLTMLTDVQLSRGAANRLNLADGDSFRIIGGQLQLDLDDTGSTQGIVWGSTADVNLYRDSADLLRTDDVFYTKNLRLGDTYGISIRPGTANEWVWVEGTGSGGLALNVVGGTSGVKFYDGAWNTKALLRDGNISLGIHNVMPTDTDPFNVYDKVVDTTNRVAYINTSGDLTLSGDLTVGTWAAATAVHVCKNGDTLSTCSSAAEYVPTFGDVEEGDLISISPNQGNPYVDPKRPFVAEKATKPYDPNLMGFILKPELGADGEKINDQYLPLGIYGYFPIKVSTINGPIERGDLITSSEIPGVGMRATKAGFTVGRALEPYNNPDADAVGKIQVFVNLGWYDPGALVDTEGDLAQETSDGTTEKIITNEIRAETGIFQRIRVAIEAIFEKITAKTAEIASAVIQTLRVEKAEIKTLKVEALSTGENTDSAGSGVIKEGEGSVTIESLAVTERSKIYVTFTTDYAPATRFWIGQKVPPSKSASCPFEALCEGGFTVELDAPVAKEARFDYWIVN